MKTAVQFLVETLAENGILHSSDIEQAKEMEKQHIIDAYRTGFLSEDIKLAGDYYNEVFKNK